MDDHCVFSLFGKLVRVLGRSGVVSSVESKTTVEDFTTFVVDVRTRHLGSGCQVEDIADVIKYLPADYEFDFVNLFLYMFCYVRIRRSIPFWFITQFLVEYVVMYSSMRYRGWFAA